MKELQMLRSGLDTLSIASKTGQTEAQVWNAITRQRQAESEPCYLHGRARSIRRPLIPYAGKEAS